MRNSIIAASAIVLSWLALGLSMEAYQKGHDRKLVGRAAAVAITDTECDAIAQAEARLVAGRILTHQLRRELGTIAGQ